VAWVIHVEVEKAEDLHSAGMIIQMNTYRGISLVAFHSKSMTFVYPMDGR